MSCQIIMFYMLLGLGKETLDVECSSDDECVAQLACVKGTCKNPCSLLPCGQNAYCESDKHAAWCKCSAGYVESIFGECVSREYLNYIVLKYNTEKNYYFTHFILLQHVMDIFVALTRNV